MRSLSIPAQSSEQRRIELTIREYGDDGQLVGFGEPSRPDPRLTTLAAIPYQKVTACSSFLEKRRMPHREGAVAATPTR